MLSMTKMYLINVPTRKVGKIVGELCGHSISRSHVGNLEVDPDKKLTV
jgi:hypothetical protein